MLHVDLEMGWSRGIKTNVLDAVFSRHLSQCSVTAGQLRSEIAMRDPAYTVQPAEEELDLAALRLLPKDISGAKLVDG